MSHSKCGSCGSSSFKMVEQPSIANSKYKLLFVQCGICNVVIGVMDYFNLAPQVNKIEKRLAAIESYVANIDHNVVVVANKVKR